MRFSGKVTLLGAENGQFQHNRASNAFATENENFIKRNN